MSTHERIGTIREAINEALHEEMARDDRVFLMGEDIGVAGGVFKVTAGLLDAYGPERVIDTPISEAGIVGLAVGAAMTGRRPIVEIMFSDFTTLASDQIVNQAAKLRYMTAGQCTIPMVIRTAMGAGRRAAAQHSQSLHAWFAHIPGIKVVMPSTPEDAKGLLKSAIRDDNPVMFLEDKMMYNQSGPIPDGDYTIEIGKARIHRSGDAATIICTSSMLYPSFDAADRLAKDGFEIEIIDPRTIKPLDEETLIESAKKTGKVLVVDEGYQSFGVTAEIAARVMEGAFDYLEEPIKRLGAADVPVPFAPNLEDLTIPSAEQIYSTIKGMIA
ncbi:MAG: alpha-ketoacid dehydrogenase subunit beta [Anaerolineales bacterium]|nr:alpha-ketoacid dehydrogenase subunit beta [Anaerolineales bacterium]HEY61770.1 alpha-ketoacid dehydrogenase subunit beta [Anaerolineae bacterium]